MSSLALWPVTASLAIAFEDNFIRQSQRILSARKATHLLEEVGHLRLVVDHVLPGAGSLRIVRDRKVRLETHRALIRERIGNLGSRLSCSRRESLVTLEQDLKEDLRVEGKGGRVEGNGLAVVDECVGASNGVRDEQVDEVRRAEASVRHAFEDHCNGVLRLGDEAGGGGDGRILATCEELETGGSRAVRHPDGTRELDHITNGDSGEHLKEWRDGVDRVVDTCVGS